MKNAISCPSHAVLKEFLGGNMAESEISEIVQHLENCSKCEKAISGLQVDDTLVEILESSEKTTEPRAEDQLVVELLIDRISKLDISKVSAEYVEGSEELLQCLSELGLSGKSQLGPYSLVRVLGRGGMSVVFEAKDLRLKRHVAIKVLRQSRLAGSVAKELMLSEAQAIAIEHENIVSVYDIAEDQGVMYLAMQLLQGETLESRLRRDQKLDVETTMSIARQVVAALQSASKRGIVHRDISPSNIWLERSHQSESKEARGVRIKLLDFGLAGVLGCSGLADSKLLVGTPPYMSPEQARGSDVDARSDLFSLGCVMYRMLVGKSPFQGATKAETLQLVTKHIPQSLNDIDASIPVSLAELVERLLSKEPHNRPDVDATVTALRELRLDSSSSGRNRRKVFAYVAIGMSIIAAVLSVIYIKTNSGTLVLEVYNDEVKTVVDGRQVAISSPHHSIELSVGEHLLEVHKDGFKTLTKQFSISRGDEVEVDVRLEPDEPPPLAAGITKEFKVSADTNWTSTGINLAEGTQVTISASGAIQAAPDSDTREYYHNVPPEGRDELQQQFPHPRLPGLGLIARIGSGPIHAVGSDLTLTAGATTGTGVLHLGINDDIVDDNSGHWLVKVSSANESVSKD